MPTESDFTKILNWPGYLVYRHEIDERHKKLSLSVRRKRGNGEIECSGCGRKFREFYDMSERAVQDLPWGEFQATVYIELYRVKCPECGVKREKVLQLPSKAPFSKRFEEAVGEACQSASARQVAGQFRLPASTVRAIDLRYLERWAAGRRKPALREIGVDEICLGKKQKFVTVVSNLESREPLWFGEERKKETWEEFFRTQVSGKQQERVEAACLDMWEPYRLSLEQWVPRCRLLLAESHWTRRLFGAMLRRIESLPLPTG